MKTVHQGLNHTAKFLNGLLFLLLLIIWKFAWF